MQLEFKVDLTTVQRCKKPPSNGLRNPAEMPPLTKLLVLAYQIEQAIEDGRSRDYSDVARQLGLTRVRITQIVNLRLLSPMIQATILTSPESIRHINERRLRKLVEESDWQKQNRASNNLVEEASIKGDAVSNSKMNRTSEACSSCESQHEYESPRPPKVFTTSNASEN